MPLDSHDLYDRLTWAWTVQLYEKDTLVRAKLKFAANDGNALTGAKGQMLAVRVSVGRFIRVHIDGSDLKIIVPVCPIFRSDVFQQIFQVFHEQRLQLIDLDCRSSVF